jgi:secernin
MGGDMVVALGRATGTGRVVFGHNSHRPVGDWPSLVRIPGRSMAPGETVQAEHVQLAQVRQTCTVLGSQPPGCWGLSHGLNEYQVAVGHASWGSRLAGLRPGLTGAELTRLTLERCRSARQALDVLTDLISRYGQAPARHARAKGDHVFLVVDPSEAYAVEAAGNAWVVQEIRETRAAGDVAVIRQDWDRIAPGLAGRAIEQGWWNADGSKLDFVGSLCDNLLGEASALRRWGRATFLLEQHSGNLDATVVRRLLADHYQGTSFEAHPGRVGGPEPPCRHGADRGQLATAASLVVELDRGPDSFLVAWWAFGPPCVNVFFPVFIEAELPAFFQGDASGRQRLRGLLGEERLHQPEVLDRLGQLQARFDLEVADFAQEAAALARQGKREERRRLARLLMQSHAEHFDDTVQDLARVAGRVAVAAVPEP